MTVIDESKLPDFDDLPGSEGFPKDTSWGLFGDSYELGTLNFLTPERVAEAAKLAKTGRRFNLSLPLNLPSHTQSSETKIRPSWMPEPKEGEEPPGRKPYTHDMFLMPDGLLKDEVIQNFNPQASSQWDGLGHIRHPKHGGYNGVSPDDIRPGDESKLSIGKWAQAGGIFGRGVLIDVVRNADLFSEPYDPKVFTPITPDIIEGVCERQGVEVRAGDILCFYTGWIEAFADERGDFQVNLLGVGLSPGKEIPRWLWDHRVAAVCADNTGLEAYPWEPQRGRSLHTGLLNFLGMPLGELFDLKHLAADCAADGVYEFFFCAVPLNLPGGVGSPANAVAIK